MKLIVMSDSHGYHERIFEVMQAHPDADAYLHCGDIELEDGIIPNLITVLGNNDLFYDYPSERILTLNGHRIFMTHGHRFSYVNRLEDLAKFAIQQDCDVVLYGHTHVAAHDICNGIHLINPGSLYRSRDGRGPSYAIVTLDQGIDVEFVFRDKRN